MAKRIPALAQLSTAELKKLLAARERIDALEAERGRLAAELASVERELALLLRGKPARKAVKKAARKAGGKAAAKKTAKKKTATKTAKKTAKKVVKKTAKQARKAPAQGKRVRLEDVILGVLRKAGKPMAYPALRDKIVKGKLFPTRAKSFDNVLRRTLSTSNAVRRVSRGVYAPA